MKTNTSPNAYSTFRSQFIVILLLVIFVAFKE